VSASGERVSAGLLAAAAAGYTILAPNSELATAVFAALERAHRDRGEAVWPTPKVLDFATWLRQQYAYRQLQNADSPRCLTELEERELWRSVIEAEERGRDFLDPAAAARAARRARRAIQEYGIPLRAIDRELSEESEAFLKWNQAFDERCRALQCISADALLDRVAAPQSALAWIESPAWRPVARQWLAGNGLLLMPEQIPAPQAAEQQRPRASPLPWPSRVGAASPAAELSALASWAQFNLQADARFRAWVCIPDLNQRRAEVVDAMDAALARQRFSLRYAPTAAPYAVAGGTSLAGFAPVRIALETLTVSMGAVSFPRFSVLLRTPEMQATPADASAAAALDVALRSRAPSEADIDTWLGIAERVARTENLGPVAAVQRLRAVRRALTGLRNTERISHWVSAWITALEAGPWAERSRWSSMEYQAAERFRELLAEMATAEFLFGSISPESALRALKRASHDTAFQPQTGVPAIWVSGQLIDPWVNYTGIWVTRCSDEYWPPRVEPIALLPVRLQREYGVIAAAAETQLNLAIDLQRRWRARALQCVFSFADPGDGRSSAASPLLPPNTLMPPERDWTLPSAAPQPHWRALLDAAPPLESLSDESAPPFAADERTRGVSTLKAQSRCAFRGFAETRLAAKAMEQPVPGFNERERGDLVHHALEQVWSVLRNSDELQLLSPGAQRQLLEQAAVGAIALISERRDPGPRWRARERARLSHLLALWLDVERKRAPFAVEYLEQGAQVAQFAGLNFTVRIDRVDRLTDGARVLIDYKTGAAIADWRGDRPDNPQLPIYALLRREALVAVAYARVNAGDSGFIADAERRDIFKVGSRSSALEGMPNFAALVGLWSRRVERLAAAFASGSAEVAPTLKACQTCNLHGLCRVPAPLEPAEDANE
jgi:ATP-dependent helicase/nuclease subunit B